MCNARLFIKYLIWRSKVKDFPWAMMQVNHDLVKVLIDNGSECLAIREILADHSIGIPVRAPFP